MVMPVIWAPLVDAIVRIGPPTPHLPRALTVKDFNFTQRNVEAVSDILQEVQMRYCALYIMQGAKL